ncbi:MAG: PD-(D/E)XK nuclease family protein [Candidatus Bipolaricaulaceae bacterium]
MLKERLELYFQREDHARKRDYFFVSEVAKCPRQIFYTAHGFPRPPLDGQTARRLAVGEAAHQRILQALYGLGVVVAAEAPIPPNPLFHGRADAIVSLDGRNYVVEIKTAHPYSFEQMAVAPRQDHHLQLQLYLHYLDIPQGIILAENKANQEFKEFAVARDDRQVAQVLASFSHLKDLIFGRRCLPPLPDKVEWAFDQCRYCPYSEFCEQNVVQPPGAVQPPPGPAGEAVSPRLFDDWS